jgi:hypothetical protein
MEYVLARSGESRFAPRPPPIKARDWLRVVGLRIADRTKPIAIERATLIVHCASATWATELSMLRDPILARLQALGFPVREVRFRVKPMAPPPRPPERRKTRAVPPKVDLPEEVARAVALVPDLELAGIIAEAAERNLAWQDNSGVRPSEERRASRAPRAAETGSAPRDRNSEGPRASPRRNRGGA